MNEVLEEALRRIEELCASIRDHMKEGGASHEVCACEDARRLVAEADTIEALLG